MTHKVELDPLVDHITSSLSNLIEQAAKAYLDHRVRTNKVQLIDGNVPDELAITCVRQLTMIALTKSSYSPDKLYSSEIVPFLDLVAKNATLVVQNYLDDSISIVESIRPEGTPPPPPPEPEPEELDPIMLAKQGKSKIIIPGIND